MDKKKDIETDLWFAQQMEILSQMEYKGEIDVVDDVMKQIEHIPLSATKRKPTKPSLRRMAVITGAAAACLAAVLLVRSAFPGRQINAGKQTVKELSSGIFEIFNYCQSYTDTEILDEASYNENPFTDLLAY